MKFNCHLIIHRLSAILLATTIFANLSITSALATTSKNPFQDVSENAPYAEAVQYVYDRVILNRFDDEGWSLVIGNDFIDQWSTENKTSAAGLTHYANKSIYVRSSTSVTHEFGHFLHSELGRPLIVGDLFEKR